MYEKGIFDEISEPTVVIELSRCFENFGSPGLRPLLGFIISVCTLYLSIELVTAPSLPLFDVESNTDSSSAIASS